MIAEGAAGVDADMTGYLLSRRCVAFGFGNIGKNGDAALEEGTSLWGKLQPSRRAMDKTRTEALSSLVTSLLTAEGVMRQALAAAVKPPSSTARTKTSISQND